MMSEDLVRKCGKDCPFFLSVVKDPWDEINHDPFKRYGIYYTELKRIWEEYGGVLANCALLYPESLAYLCVRCPVSNSDFELAMMRLDQRKKTIISNSGQN